MLALRNSVNRFAGIPIFLGFALLVFWRLPGIILHGGRFWAEEGCVYFLNAWQAPWYDAWFAVHTGYLNVAAGIGTWLALEFGGLANAPLVTVLIAFFLQCFPVYAMLTHAFPWRRSIPATAVTVLLCATAPVMGEVWLNTITSQFHLALFAALIFAAPAAAMPLFALDCAGLLLAVFSGPASACLAPLFVLRALRERQPKTVLLAAIALFGCCVQAHIYLANIMPQRGGRLDFTELLSAVSLHTIVLQFAGFDMAQRFGGYLGTAYAAHRLLLAGPVIFFSFYGVTGAAIWRARDKVLARLYAADILITLVSFYEALNGTFAGFLDVVGGQRYAFIPVAANALLMVGLACGTALASRYLFMLASLVLLLVSLANYRQGTAPFDAGPEWKPEVVAWQHDPARSLPIWPESWAVQLPPHQADAKP